MANLGNMSAKVMETEMEEGEIVDDYLSDISSEEEFLLRQRLQVLENYNNVLERKKAKRSLGPGTKHKKTHSALVKETDITATDFANNYNFPKNLKIQIKTNVPRAYRHLKPHHKIRRKKELHIEEHPRIKDNKKRFHKNRKRVSESSESSDDTGSEYRDKRRKLANAVIVNKEKNDKTSLSARLKKMLGSSISDTKSLTAITTEIKQTDTENNEKNNSCVNKSNEDPVFSPISSLNAEDSLLSAENEDKALSKDLVDGPLKQSELIDLCSEDENAINHNDNNMNTDICPHRNEDILNENINDSNDVDFDIKKINGKRKSISEKDSDDDLELLRQNALQTKTVKAKTPTEIENKSEDEDSDTAELRLICLKSALLKKAIEMKQKQKMQKKLSQSSNLQDDFLNEHDLLSNKITSENNTDIESVDMEIVSDGDEKFKDVEKKLSKSNNNEENVKTEGIENMEEKGSKVNTQVEDFEEDEDLLRAKLLTSLSKNLPNLVNSSILEALPNFNPEITAPKPKEDIKKVPEEKRFIIKLGESDSEGEHEATKNLTKMHMKLSEKLEFQQKLDMFLKTTRMQVEKSTLPDVIQEPTAPKKPEKFVAKAVRHLPKPEQIEYKNLVRRMAELEKIKQSRQVIIPKTVPPIETLKPRNVSDSQKPVSVDYVEQIAMSRKKIAEESAKMLKLKEEATKLSQKYKIVATELRNITTAITLNKRQQKIVQNGLNKIRLQHQTLLRSNPMKKFAQGNGHMTTLNHINNKVNPTVKLQKENDPHKEENKTQQVVRTVKITNVDRKDEIRTAAPRLSIQVTMPKSPDKEKQIDKDSTGNHSEAETVLNDRVHSTEDTRNEASHPIVEKGGGYKNTQASDNSNRRRKSIDDYLSPLQSLEISNWRADPNAILCPFEVGGECKDTECKYLHTKVTTQ